MLDSVLKTTLEFKKIYFESIDPSLFESFHKTYPFIALFIFFLLSLVLIHAVIIYIGVNLKNSYPYFKMLLLATAYSFSVSFFLGKIFQTIYELFLSLVPYAGRELLPLGAYGALITTFVFEVLLVNNRLKALYQRGHLDSEPIGSDIFIGVTLASLASFLIFFLI